MCNFYMVRQLEFLFSLFCKAIFVFLKHFYITVLNFVYVLQETPSFFAFDKCQFMQDFLCCFYTCRLYVCPCYLFIFEEEF